MGAPNWLAVAQTPPPAPVQEPAPEPPKRFPMTTEQRQTRAKNAAAARKKNQASGFGLPTGQHPCTAEIDYTEAETEFAVALDKYKREKRRPFPTNREILKVLLDLGYRKEAEPCDSTPLTSLPSTSSGASPASSSRTTATRSGTPAPGPEGSPPATAT